MFRRIVRACAFAIALLAISPVRAAPAAQEYARGEFRFSVAPIPEWVKPRAVPEKWDAGAPGASEARWRNWLIDSQIDRRHGRRSSFRENVYEPVSAELIGDAGKYQIAFVPDFQRLTIHRVELRRDGKWLDRLQPDRITLARREQEFERDMANGAVTALVVLDDVRAGDVLRVSYTIDGENPVLAGLDGDMFAFAWVDPMLDRTARVLLDPDAKPETRASAGMPVAEKHKSADALELEWHAHGIAPIHRETDVPVWYLGYPRIALAEHHTWAEIAAWARTLYPAPAPLPEDLRARVEQWKALPNVDERVMAALRAVQDEVRYFGAEIGENTHKPAEPALTWTRRYGDCKDKARLLSTLLVAMGITAQPALVSAEHGRAIADEPPAASAFDHVITRVQLPDATLWLDATLTQQRGPLRELAVADFGVALPVAPGVDKLVEVKRLDGAIDRIEVTESFQPGADGTAFEIRTKMRGTPAARMRRDLAQAGRAEIERRYTEYYRRRFGELETTRGLEVEDADDADTLVFVERYALKEAWEKASGSVRKLELASENIASEVAMPENVTRLAPLAQSHPLVIDHTITVKLPQGWRWVGEPYQLAVDDPALRYEAHGESKGDTVTLTRHFTSRKDVVPTEELAAHLRARRQIADDLHRRVLAEPSETVSAKERDARLKGLMRSILDESRAKPRDGSK